ncbi:oligosaccharide flippase family protein [Novosphingobium sp. RD2P27]|uniref:Oligosaccharide flippase family protein n=1 Tax=Novosphingobium kalidii TaxID=3230299 RepID=A0ABV2CXS9_9SPHN
MLKHLASMSSLNLFKAAVQFGIGTLVTLFVLPAEYGLITFSLPIIQLIALMTDLGLGSAIIRQRNLRPGDAGAALVLSMSLAAAAGLVLALSAAPVQHWADMPGLAPVLSTLALAVTFTIAAAIPRAMLERELRYQHIALVEGASTLTGALVCGILIGLADAGIWGVIAFHVTLQAARALAFMAMTQRHYRLDSDWRRVLPMIGFGSWVLASNVINFAARNAQSLLIGAALGATAVGLYGIAYQVMILPLMALAWPASGVLLATLSRLAAPNEDHAEPSAFGQPVMALSLLTATITFPVMAWAAIGLDYPVRMLLDPAWHRALPLISVLAPLGALQSLASYNGAVLIACGHARLQFHVNLVSSLALLAGFIASLPFGIHAFALMYLTVGSVVAAGQVGAKLWGAGIELATYARALAIPLLATLAGCAAAASYELHPASWAEWGTMTLAYACAVLAVNACGRRPILRAMHKLLPA